MKAAYIRGPCSAGEIQYGDLPDPAIGPNEALVETHAVAVDPIDTYIRSGAYPLELPDPFVVGRDAAGVVLAVGRDVRRFRPGDRVWCNSAGYGGRQGTFAERFALEEQRLYPLPAEVDFAEAVATFHSALTAYTGLVERAQLRAGESVFVAGGSGNVGAAVLQMARRLGARVAVTAGDEAKAAWCRELGAERVVLYRHESVAEALREFAAEGVDLYWDCTGQIDLEAAVAALAPRGRIVLMSGLKRQSVLPVGPFYARGAAIFGFTVTAATCKELARASEEINRQLAGGLRAKIAARLPLSQTAEAHGLVESGQVFGKVTLVPDRLLSERTG